jgi:GNAT superfamily N-acetyltransferase
VRQSGSPKRPSLDRTKLRPMIRSATRDDFDAISKLYAQLNPDDPPVLGPKHQTVFEQILDREGLDIILLEIDGEVLGATYLNLIPNLSRGAQPYAVIENVVIAKHRRGEKLGRRLMDGTLERAWASGCYKAMLQTGTKTPATHAYYRACGFADDAKTAHLARPATLTSPAPSAGDLAALSRPL